MDRGTVAARPLPLGAFAAYCFTVALVGFAVIELTYGWFGPPDWRANKGDLTIYTDATRRVLAGGQWYLDRQLAGPYHVEWGDVLYPPAALWTFLPWLVLPGWTYVLVPVAITAAVVIHHRPAPWGWVLMALCLAWPMTTFKAVSANPGVWVMASVALGTVYGWPAAFALLKPTFAVFALFGIRSRAWWGVVALLALASLPFLAWTLDYPRVVLSSDGGIGYSLWDVPMVLIPVVAWIARAR